MTLNFSSNLTPSVSPALNPKEIVRQLLLLCFLCFSSFLFAQTSVSNHTVKLRDLPADTVTNWTAEFNDSSVELNWNAAAENNLSHFIIQRSLNGSDYTDIVIFFAAEKGDKRTGYKYTDKLSPSAKGNVYYRLKTQDLAGKNRVSECLAVGTGKSSNEMISAAAVKSQH